MENEHNNVLVGFSESDMSRKVEILLTNHPLVYVTFHKIKKIYYITSYKPKLYKRIFIGVYEKIIRFS